MILDPTGEFIRNITEHCDIRDKIVLEVGCGTGRVTEDLARHARKVTATDPDQESLAAASTRIAADNVEFIRCGGETLNFSVKSFDIVIYTLSLHHIPVSSLQSSLQQAAGIVRDEGKIIVIEPGAGGTLIEAEERFYVGDGDERRQKDAAQSALDNLEGWERGQNVYFQTFFYFESQEDFLKNLLPWNRQIPETILDQLGNFLNMYRRNGRIVLCADRMMNVLARSNHTRFA